MSVWFTSDLHIGHSKVAQIRYGIRSEPAWWGAYEIRRHDEILAQHWDDMVTEDDIVWVLGDISSGTKTAQINALDWIRQRPGHKHLIAGNHDGVHPQHRDSHKWLPIYTGALAGLGDPAFETVQIGARRRIPLVPEGHTDVLLSHFPYEGDHTVFEGDRYVQWRLPDLGTIVVHGHTHSSEKISYTRKPSDTGLQLPPTPQLHVGVDAWGGKLVPLEWIVEQVQEWHAKAFAKVES